MPRSHLTKLCRSTLHHVRKGAGWSGLVQGMARARGTATAMSCLRSAGTRARS